MEVYPEKMDGTQNIMHYAHDAVYHPFFLGIRGLSGKYADAVNDGAKTSKNVELLLVLLLGTI